MPCHRTSKLSYFIVFLLLVTLFSCQKKSTMTSQKSRSEVEPAPLEISKVNVLDWQVGPSLKQTISRGISILVELPLLETDDLQKLVADRKVNAWLVQLHRRGTSGMELLARTAVPLTGYKSQMKTISFPVQYAASAISMRRADMRCPSFDHRYSIGETEIALASNTGLNKFIVGPSQDKPQRGRFNLFQVRPESINGGHRLQGDYRVELALFDRKDKRLRSNFVSYPQIVKVRSETKKFLEGCQQYKENDNARGGYEDFDFGN